MVGVDQDYHVDRNRNARIIRFGEHRGDIAEILAVRPFAEITHHVRFRVYAIDMALRQGAREPHCEVTGARADVGNPGVRRERERAQDFIRLLPIIARGVIEEFCPSVRTGERVLVVLDRLRHREAA